MDPIIWIIGLVLVGTIVYTLVKRSQGKNEFDRLVLKMRTLDEPDQELLEIGRIIDQWRKKQYDPSGTMTRTKEQDYNMAYAEAYVLMEQAKKGDTDRIKWTIGRALKGV